MHICVPEIFRAPDPDHAYKIIKAAMEIQDFVEKYNVSQA